MVAVGAGVKMVLERIGTDTGINRYPNGDRKGIGNRDKKGIGNGDKRVSETGIKRVSETGKILVLKNGKICAILDTLFILTCGRQNGKNFGTKKRGKLWYSFGDKMCMDIISETVPVTAQRNYLA